MEACEADPRSAALAEATGDGGIDVSEGAARTRIVQWITGKLNDADVNADKGRDAVSGGDPFDISSLLECEGTQDVIFVGAEDALHVPEDPQHKEPKRRRLRPVRVEETKQEIPDQEQELQEQQEQPRQEQQQTQHPQEHQEPQKPSAKRKPKAQPKAKSQTKGRRGKQAQPEGESKNENEKPARPAPKPRQKRKRQEKDEKEDTPEDVEARRREFEIWVEKHPEYKGKANKSAKLPKPTRPPPPTSEMGRILYDAARLKPPPVPKPDEALSATQPNAAAVASAPAAVTSGVPVPQSLPATPSQSESGDRVPHISAEDFLGDFALAMQQGDGTEEAASDAQPESHEPNGQSVAVPVNDLLLQGQGDGIGQFCLGQFGLDGSPGSEPLGSDFFDPGPQAAGEPQVLGPQLRLDSAGNIVLNQASLSHNLNQGDEPEEVFGAVHESVAQYEKAYKRTKPIVWTSEETDRFYEALEQYGTDLFLVQTFFLDKSAHQIKSKYSKELKKNPQKVEEYVLKRAKKLTAEKFEELHGPIDVTKHFKPEDIPPPGEMPEGDAAADPTGQAEPEPDMAEEEDRFPLEPEYTEDDAAESTNRLMEMFDDCF